MTPALRLLRNCLLLALCALLLVGCGSRGGGSWRKGGVTGTKPYTVRGKTYYPLKSAHGFVEVGEASWYGPGFHGKTTANGERYNQYAMTAAHKLLPLGTKVRVTHMSNGRSIIVRINDRGPFVGDRIIDLARCRHPVEYYRARHGPGACAKPRRRAADAQRWRYRRVLLCSGRRFR